MLNPVYSCGTTSGPSLHLAAAAIPIWMSCDWRWRVIDELPTTAAQHKSPWLHMRCYYSAFRLRESKVPGSDVACACEQTLESRGVRDRVRASLSVEC
jgi:hypothetical protein